MKQSVILNIAQEIRNAGFNCKYDKKRNAIIFMGENRRKVQEYLNKNYGTEKAYNSFDFNKMFPDFGMSIPFTYIMVGDEKC